MTDVYDGLTIVSEGAGPPGVPAAQDLGFAFTNGYHPSEIFPSLAITHPATYTGAGSAFESEDRPTTIKTFPILHNGVAVGAAVMDPLTCGAGPVYHGTVTLAPDPLQAAFGDIVGWQAPAGTDATFSRGSLTLGSQP